MKIELRRLHNGQLTGPLTACISDVDIQRRTLDKVSGPETNGDAATARMDVNANNLVDPHVFPGCVACRGSSPQNLHHRRIGIITHAARPRDFGRKQRISHPHEIKSRFRFHFATTLSTMCQCPVSQSRAGTNACVASNVNLRQIRDRAIRNIRGEFNMGGRELR